MKTTRSLALLVGAAMGLSACASIVNGSKQDVSIKATPSDATIWVDGEQVGTGSADIQLKRGKEHVVEVKKSGYRTAKVTTDKSLSGWFWGNILCGGIPGGAVDLITGSAYDVDPDRISITLDKGTGMLEAPMDKNIGEIDVQAEDGQRLATITLNWQ
jgi:hypothetical protein